MAPRRDGSRSKQKGSGGVRRALHWLAFLPIASRVPTYSRLVWALASDDRTPLSRKVLLIGALGYLLSPRDLVPDDIPILGGIDDLAVVVLAVDLFLDGVPEEVLDEQLDALGIDREAFERDVAQVRRLTPGPLRRVLRRIPGAIEAGGRAITMSGLGPRLRAWITKEESVA